MYIDKWWGEYLGESEDSYTLIDYFNEGEEKDYPLSKIFRDFYLEEQIAKGSFRTTADIRYMSADGVHYSEIDIVINLMTDIAAILLECLHNEEVSLKDLNDGIGKKKKIRVTPTPGEFDCLLEVLEDFASSYMDYELAELCDEETMKEIAGQCFEIAQELRRYR
ncbi:imm68 putative immunity domain-containing protein [Filifactor villosus]|uniref:Imm68 putative immunity domain-containing protein n=1 Tax=Filifactor villosus TaxID=29374 RepID=A0ABV9QQ83_9FIRM